MKTRTPDATMVAAGIALILATAPLVDNERIQLDPAIDGSFGITVDGWGFVVVVIEQED